MDTMLARPDPRLPARALPQPPLPKPPVTTRLRSQLESFLVLQRNPLELWGKGAYEQGDLPGSFLGRRQVMLNTPDAIRRVLVENHDNYRRNVATRRVLQPVLGDGLFLAEGAAWRHQRRTVAPSFVPRTMPVLARHVVAASEATEARLAAAAGRSVELLPILQHLALTIAGQSMFSLEMSAFGDELRGLLIRYAARFARPGFLDLMLPGHIPSPTDRGRAAFRTEWLRLMDRLIDARTSQPRQDDTPRDLLDLLLAARDPETGAPFTRAQLRDEVATLILAGHETTGVTLFWACWLAARLPHEAERVAREAATADLSPEAAGTALKSLPVTRAFIDETLRLYPPAFLIVRQAIAADRVGTTEIAPGTIVSISPWVLHRHRRLWTNPDGFDLDRFLPGAPPPDRFAYMPFGAGPRICVGAQFALTEAVIVLARLLRRFHLSFLGSGAVIPRALVTTQPDRPVRFLFTPR